MGRGERKLKGAHVDNHSSMFTPNLSPSFLGMERGNGASLPKATPQSVHSWKSNADNILQVEINYLIF